VVVAAADPAPDFDTEIEAMLQDPRIVPRLDDLHGRLEQNELELVGDDEARKIVGLDNDHEQ
jgi:hypothetical protein